MTISQRKAEEVNEGAPSPRSNLRPTLWMRKKKLKREIRARVYRNMVRVYTSGSKHCN